jgi:EmrB/QacA subfamily drug resistance transporter
MVGTFLGSLDVTIVGTAMPSIAAKLGGLGLYGWAFSAYMLASTVTVPVYGRLADVWGRKPAYLLGLVAFVVGSVACAVAWSMPVLVAARGLQGLGAGAIVPLTLVAVGDMYPADERSGVMSLFSLVWGTSSIVGPTLGGLLVTLGWPWVFWVNVPIGVAAFVVLSAVWREPKGARAEGGVDVRGALLVTLATLAVLYAMKAFEDGAVSVGAACLVTGALLGGAFLRLERRAVAPVFSRAVARDRVIAIAAIVGVLIGGALFVPVAFVPLYLRAVLGHSAPHAGFALIPMSFLWTLGAYVSGKLVKRFGFRAPIVLGGGAIALGGSALFAGVSLASTVVVVIGSGLLGSGMGLTVTATNIVAQERVSFEERGGTTALLQFSRTMGGTLFVSALGLVVAHAVALRVPELGAASRALTGEAVDGAVGAAVHEALASGLRDVFGVSALAALGVLGLSLLFPRMDRDGKSEVVAVVLE